MPSFSVEKIKGIVGPLPALRGGVWEGKLPLERSGKVGRKALVTTRMSLADTGAERSKPDRKRVSLTCGIKKQTTKEKCRTHRNEKNGGSQGLEAGGHGGRWSEGTDFQFRGGSGELTTASRPYCVLDTC